MQPFVDVIKNIKIPKILENKSKRLYPKSKKFTITQVKELQDTFIQKNWRRWPMALEIPAPSQIFGHMVYTAGIQGILYTSCWDKKPCMAIFPQNLKNTQSYVQLIDDAPKGVIKKLDQSTYKQLV